MKEIVVEASRAINRDQIDVYVWRRETDPELLYEVESLSETDGWVPVEGGVAATPAFSLSGLQFRASGQDLSWLTELTAKTDRAQEIVSRIIRDEVGGLLEMYNETPVTVSERFDPILTP
jgi:hypothetical protein|tara:strand:- start:229 stop:588 length:360 start_codon:yes stop_codon:yes gene_type:complete